MTTLEIAVGSLAKKKAARPAGYIPGRAKAARLRRRPATKRGLKGMPGDRWSWRKGAGAGVGAGDETGVARRSFARWNYAMVTATGNGRAEERIGRKAPAKVGRSSGSELWQACGAPRKKKKNVSGADLIIPSPGVPAGGTDHIFWCWRGEGHTSEAKSNWPYTVPGGKKLIGITGFENGQKRQPLTAVHHILKAGGLCRAILAGQL